jgi:hypothetical protein
VPQYGHQVKRSRVLELAGGSASDDLEQPRSKYARPETDYKKVQITAAGQSGRFAANNAATVAQDQVVREVLYDWGWSREKVANIKRCRDGLHYHKDVCHPTLTLG